MKNRKRKAAQESVEAPYPKKRPLTAWQRYLKVYAETEGRFISIINFKLPTQ